MGLSGLVGAGAMKGLEDILTEQMVKARFAEEQRRAQAQEAMQRERDAQRVREHDDVMGRYAKQDERQAAADEQSSLDAMRGQQAAQASKMSELQDYADYEQATSDPASMPPLRRLGAVSKIIKGASMKDVVTPEERAAESAAAESADLGNYEKKKRIDARYRPATGGGDSKQQWLVRGGKKVYGAYQPGDEPYDAVAERKPQSATGPSPYAAERANRTIQAVDDLIGKVGMSTAGLGSLMANIPGTGARDFSAQLNTLKGNIAFNELAQMREASKTGGALGAVSERELALLESTLGALDAGQSPDQLREQLAQVKESVLRWQQAATGASAGIGTDAEMPPGDFSVKAPNGKVYPFKTAAEAAEFKRKAGIP